MAHFLLVVVCDGTCNISFNLILYSLLWFFLIKFTAYFLAGADEEWRASGLSKWNTRFIKYDYWLCFALSLSCRLLLSASLLCFQLFPNSFSIRFRLHHTTFSSFHSFSVAVPLFPPTASLFPLLFLVMIVVVVVTSGTSKRQKTTTLIAAVSATARSANVSVSVVVSVSAASACRKCISYLSWVSQGVNLWFNRLRHRRPRPRPRRRRRRVPDIVLYLCSMHNILFDFAPCCFFGFCLLNFACCPIAAPQAAAAAGGGLAQRQSQRQGRNAAGCAAEGHTSLKHIETCVFQSFGACMRAVCSSQRCAMIWFICTQLYDIYMSRQPRRTAANRTKLKRNRSRNWSWHWVEFRLAFAACNLRGNCKQCVAHVTRHFPSPRDL